MTTSVPDSILLDPPPAGGLELLGLVIQLAFYIALDDTFLGSILGCFFHASQPMLIEVYPTRQSVIEGDSVGTDMNLAFKDPGFCPCLDRLEYDQFDLLM